MGTFYIPIEIAGINRERFETVDALVDTGATYSSMPASMLNSLGVTPSDRRRFRLADGSRIYRDMGKMSVRMDGEVQATQVIFSDDAANPILGALTLQEFSMAVDPVGKRLVPTDAIVGIRT